MNQKIKLENGKLLITKEVESLNNDEIADIDQLKLELRMELSNIIRQVKGLKQRAVEIQNILKELDVD